jgi:hypothetical protein
MLESRRPPSRAGRPLLPTESPKSGRAAGAPHGRRREVLVLLAVGSLMLVSLVRLTWATPSGAQPLTTGGVTTSPRDGSFDRSLSRQAGRAAGGSPGPAATVAAPAVAAAGTDGDSVHGSHIGVQGEDGCHMLAGTELPGEVVRWGDGHTTDSAGATMIRLFLSGS